MNAVFKIYDVVNLQSGVATIQGHGVPCRILSAKSIHEYGIDWSGVESAYATTKTKPIQRKDILVVNRGRFSVALVGDDLPDGGVATPSFVFTLRPATSDLLSEYLYYYLNTKKIQNRMRALQQGSGVQFVSRADLLDLKISLPPIEVQRKIANLYMNVLKLKQMKQKQIDLLDNYMNALAAEVFKNG